MSATTRKALVTMLLGLGVIACVAPRVEGVQMFQREGWIHFRIDDSLLPPLREGYKDPGPPRLGQSTPVQRELVSRAREFVDGRLKEAGTCLKGFDGPETVYGNLKIRSYDFRVRCKD